MASPYNGPLDLEGLLSYVQEELDSIRRDLVESSTIELRPIYAEPTKLREGMLVFADGTVWNPGGGKGVYTYSSGAWVKL